MTILFTEKWKVREKSIRHAEAPDAVFPVKLTEPLEDPEEIFFQLLGELKVVAAVSIKNFIIKNIQVWLFSIGK